jgi:hypothetical protein
MPNTLIREGYIDSDRVSGLTDFQDRVFFRMLLIADDAGRTDGRVEKLRSVLFPTRESVRIGDIKNAIEALEQKQLIRSWKWEDKAVIQVCRWQRRSNAQYSRYPDPSGAFEIKWDSRETRDGKVSFCSTSIQMGSLTHQEPIANPSSTTSFTSADTDTDTKTDTVYVPPQWAEPSGWQNVTDKLKAEWSEAYPACNIEMQLNQMSQWLKANPTKARKSNWLKFITNWLKRSQDRGGDTLFASRPRGATAPGKIASLSDFE